MEEINLFEALAEFGSINDLDLKQIEVVFGRPMDSFNMTYLVDRGLKVTIDPECPYPWIIRESHDIN